MGVWIMFRIRLDPLNSWDVSDHIAHNFLSVDQVEVITGLVVLLA